MEDDKAGLLTDCFHPDGGQHEVGLLVGGQVALGQGRGAAVWQGLTTTQSIVVMDVDD